MLSPSSALPPHSPYIHKLCCLFEQNTDVFPYRFTRTGVPQRDTTVPTAWLQMPDTPLAMPRSQELLRAGARRSAGWPRRALRN